MELGRVNLVGNGNNVERNLTMEWEMGMLVWGLGHRSLGTEWEL